jgi:hypothetical protein
MTTAQVNAVVRLTHDVPTLWLNRGDVGTVQSIWQSPVYRYEVEFSKPGQASVRALLGADLIELVQPEQVNAGREKEQTR